MEPTATPREIPPDLRSLMLIGKKKIGDDGAQRLATSLLSGFSIRLNRIFLGRNLITATGGVALANALRQTPVSVTHFSSVLNTIGDLGAIAFADVVRTNKNLVYLKLDSAGISTVGAVALASALRYNSTLRELSLGANPINIEAAAAFLSGLRRRDELTDTFDSIESSNHSLRSLKIDWNVVPGATLPPTTAAALESLKIILTFNKHDWRTARRMKIAHHINKDPLVLHSLAMDRQLIPFVLSLLGKCQQSNAIYVIMKNEPVLFENCSQWSSKDKSANADSHDDIVANPEVRSIAIENRDKFNHAMKSSGVGESDEAAPYRPSSVLNTSAEVHNMGDESRETELSRTPARVVKKCIFCKWATSIEGIFADRFRSYRGVSSRTVSGYDMIRLRPLC